MIKYREGLQGISRNPQVGNQNTHKIPVAKTHDINPDFTI